MSAKITTQFGHAVPPAPRHSVTVHMPTWENVERYGADSRSVIATFQNAYPRMKPHRDIADLANAVLKHVGLRDQACLLFSSLQSAKEAIEYSTSPRRDNGLDKKPLASHQIQIRAFQAKDYFYAIIHPSDKSSVVNGFWVTPGVGISSRFAHTNLDYLSQLVEVDCSERHTSRSNFDAVAHAVLRQRIIQYLDRAPLHPALEARPTVDDVYLFPTGMASICKPHTYLNNPPRDTVVLFGMAFMNTITAFQDFGSGFKFFGLGTEKDLLALEGFLADERRHGRKVQAIWAEFPSNPILVTPNLARLRALADEYDTILAIDDTIGSFASIDITNMTDVLVTSLTKSFNGYADAIAGSVVLNPASQKYHELKSLFDEYYVPELYVADAEAIEQNSRDYLSRTIKLNHNAISLVEYLHSCAEDPESAVHNVHYSAVNESGEHYKKFMRPATPEFTPGYGCLFNVELEDLPTTIAFYNNLNVHNGPHLGAPFTLAFAYTMCIYKTRLDWAAEYGLKPTQIRISAGLEDTEILLDDFKMAVKAANKARSS